MTTPDLSLPPLPLTLRTLTNDQAHWLEERYSDLPASPAQCITCLGTKSFVWYSDGTRTEVGKFACPCDDQYILHRVLLYSGIGLNYQRLDWLDFFELPKEKIEIAKDYISNGAAYISSGIGMILHGEKGNGKTLFASLILKRIIGELDRDGYLTTFSELLDTFAGGWRSREERAWFTRRIRNAGVLVIDDLGREYKGAKSIGDSALEETLRHRVQQARPTILTTNLSPADIQAGYGGHSMSVLSERSIFVEFAGADRRPDVRKRMIDEIKQGLTRPVVL